MTVYIDDAYLRFRRCIMCHMTADTEAELHEMAQKVDLRRSWYQYGGRHPHYDISKAKRAKAVELGAVEVTARQMPALSRAMVRSS